MKRKERVTMTSTTNPMSLWGETYKQVAEGYSKTMQAGVKFFEDTTRLYTDLAARTMEETRVRVEKVTHDTVELNKHGVERAQAFFEEQTRRNASLTPYMFDPASMNNPAEYFDRVAALWRTSFETVRDSISTIAKNSGEMMEGWSKVCRVEPVTVK